MDADTKTRHIAEVRRAFVAANRLRLYAVMAAALGVVAIIAVIGSMIIGWMSGWDGMIGVFTAVLFALVPAARFYADALRTTLNASGMERTLGMDVDLYDHAAEREQKIRTLALVSLAIAAIAVAVIIGYAVANAGTEKPDDDDDRGEVDDDRDDDRDGGEQNDSGGSGESDDDDD